MSANTARNWTIAYRMSKYANHFKRVTNWSGTWSEARLMAVEFETHNPGAEVWYVRSLENEKAEAAAIAAGDVIDYGQSEDWGNILMEDGKKRVTMRETGLVTDEMIESVKVQAWSEDQQAAMNLAMAQDAITTHVKTFDEKLALTVVTDDYNNVNRYADVRGDSTHESRKWRVVGAVKAEGQSLANYYAVVWRGDANRKDTSKIVHRSMLTNLY